MMTRPRAIAASNPPAETAGDNLTPVATTDASPAPNPQKKVTPAQSKARQLAVKGKPVPAHAPAKRKTPAPVNALMFDGSVYSIATSGDTLIAETSSGLLTSQDDGVSWTATGPAGSSDWRFLAAARQHVVAATLREVMLSSDGGMQWAIIKLPGMLTQIATVAIEPNGEVWVGGREGVFVSSDSGNTWAIPKNAYLNSVNNIFYDEATDRVTITSSGNSSYVFTVLLPGKRVDFTDTGWNLRFARPMGDHLIAATMFDGIVVQPRAAASSSRLPAVGEASITTKPVTGTPVKQD
jgi:photosystem II stability/assembly factor-like uncharacterized protein